MRMYDLIEKKKHGEALTRDEIFEFIKLYTAGDIPDYQISALMMAIYFRGMEDREIFDLTEAMASSGDTVDLSRFGTRSVDKHSTGGVGDKTTLIVAPTVAAVGGAVAKMSGRGLGHTGGTVDKLESFPGFKTSLSPEDFMSQVEDIGIAVIGQSGDLAPADKKLYALRDVTATVDSIPLIASSIMSKKLAAGTQSIVLDVKCGSGAFMQTPEAARELAETMVRIGKAHGRRTAALITNMDVPLGHNVGNVLEVKEAIEVLRGGGPADLKEVCLALASKMVSLSLGLSDGEAMAKVTEAIDSGAAYEKFCEWIERQGGNSDFARDPSLFGEAEFLHGVYSRQDGYLYSIDAEKIGTAAMMLGAGRESKDSVINYKAGIVLTAKPGELLKKGDLIALMHSDDEALFSRAEPVMREALTFSEKEPPAVKLIYEIIS